MSSTDGTNTVYYHCSHFGNVNLITDSSGNVIQAYDYDAFGNIISQSGSLTNAYKYKSKETCLQTGLVYFGARYYDPLIGRFISADPLGMVDGVNLYLYCGNDGVNYFDPWGECWTDSITDYFNSSIDQMSQPEFLAMVDDLAMGMALGTAGGASGIGGKTSTYWQYFTKGWKKFKSKWFVKGVKGKPPYKLGKEAREALNLPRANKGTAVQPYTPKTKNFVGPRHPRSQPDWNPPINRKGKGWEYYDGPKFPD